MEDSLAERKGGGTRATIARHSVALLCDGEFRKLLLGFGLGLAVFNALLTLLAQLIQPLYAATGAQLNQATEDSGLYGGILISAGLIGAAIVGPVLDHTHAYRPILKGGFLAAMAGLVFMLSQLRPDNG
eukprot:SAG11_NODE_21006_length_434_cov_0.764179_1_plen_128_part_01